MKEKKQYYITPEDNDIAIHFNNVTASWYQLNKDEVCLTIGQAVLFIYALYSGRTYLVL